MARGDLQIPTRSVVLGLVVMSLSVVNCDSKHGTRQASPTVSAHAQALTPSNGGVVERGALVGNDGSGTKNLPIVPAQLVTASVPPKAAAPPAARVPAQRARDRLLAEASSADPTNLILTTLILDDVPADWEAFSAMSDRDLREVFIEQRRAALDPTRAQLISWLNSVGAQEIGTTWLKNHVHAKIPAKYVPDAVKRPEVVDAAGNLPLIPARAWGGLETENATRIANLYGAGISGHHGSRRAGGRIKLGIIEWDLGNDNFPVRDHVGWKARDTWSNRIKRVEACYSFGCFDTSYSSPGNPLPHGQVVLWTAAASVEAGQDTALPGNYTDDQRAHSGNIRDAYLWYYQVTDTARLDAALNAAVADGVDIVNMSFGFYDSSPCDRYYDGSGVNDTLVSMLNAGVVPVVAAGNGFHNGGCSAYWPALRTETLAVGALDSSDSASSYTDLALLDMSSRGGMQVVLYGSGAYVNLNTIDIATPGVVWFIGSTPPNSYSAGNAVGTSIAAPIAAAFVGDMKNAFYLAGYPQNDARMLMTQTLLMGDGWNTTQITSQGTNDLTGSGRVRAHWPNNADLVSPWGWGWRQVTITTGQTIEWPVWDSGPESPLVTQWKWAVLWTEPNLDSVGDIDFMVVDKCPPGGGERTLYYDGGYQVRSRFRLAQSEISGRCLYMRAYGYNLPPEGRTFYSADYFHSGDPGQH